MKNVHATMLLSYQIPVWSSVTLAFAR